MATQTRYASKDAMMGKQIVGGTFSGWNGKDNHLPVGVSAGGSYKFRSVVYFNVDFSPMVSINSATLTLYNHNDGTNLHCFQESGSLTDIRVSRMTKDWAEGSADPGEGNLTGSLDYQWDNRADSYVTTGQGVQNDYNQNNKANGSALNIDVTDIVKSWFSGTSNLGFMIRNLAEDVGQKAKGVQFYSRSASNTDYIPKLVIDYSANTAPNKPTLSSPNNNQVITSLTPNMTGVSSDPDANDYITDVVIHSHRHLNRFKFSTSTTMADPGSGYIRVSGSSPYYAYVSNTDADGLPVDFTKLKSSLLSITNEKNNGAYYVNLNTWVSTSAYTGYSQLRYSSGTSSGYIQNNDDVYVYENDFPMWVTGATLLNAPTSFSIMYGSSPAIPSEQLISGKHYRWKALTSDKASVASPFSDWAYFSVNTAPNAPTITISYQPQTKILDQTPDVIITHSDPDPADTKMYSYRVVVEKETSPGSGSWTSTGGWDPGTVSLAANPAVTATVTLPTLEWGGSYRIKAQTSDQFGSVGPFSGWTAFKIHKTQPPTSLQPSANQITSLTPSLSAARSDSLDQIVGYYIYLEEIGSPANIEKWNSAELTTGISSGQSFSVAYAGTGLSSDKQYRWKAKLNSVLGGVSEWSDWSYFYTASADTPTISSPVGDQNYTPTPNITVNRQNNFNRVMYEVYPEAAYESPPGTVVGTSLYASAALTVSPAASSYTAVYAGPPSLEYSTYYKVRAKVSADAGATYSPWSSLMAFNTAFAGTPSPYSVAGISGANAWITDTTPEFKVDGAGAEVIDYLQVQVLDFEESYVLADTGLVDVTEASGMAAVSIATPLTPGTNYKWRARYKDTVGKTSPYATSQYYFRINKAPLSPTTLSPSLSSSPSGIFTFANTLQPTMSAHFEDDDTNFFSDSPSGWYIIVENANGNLVYSKQILSGLNNGQNTYLITASDYTFQYDNLYSWKTYYSDQKNESGAYSQSYQFTFVQTPNGTWTTPSLVSAGQTVTFTTISPTFVWSYSGGTQYSFNIKIDEVDDLGGLIANTTKSITQISSSNSYVIPAGYFEDQKKYRVILTVTNSGGVADTEPSVSYVYINTSAPAAITGVNTTGKDNTSILVAWDASTNSKFTRYNIYRKLLQDSGWTLIAKITSQGTTEYVDWYAGNNIKYQYKVTVIASTGPNGADLESGEATNGGSIDVGVVDADIWQFIPVDRSPSFTQELPVIDASYNKVVQQESFETLGSNRKTIIRGFVLGDEGSITCVWKNEDVPSHDNTQVFYNETILGRRMLEYVTKNKGPHVLKSPFGDVWDVQFEAPEIVWLPGGILQASISWVETGVQGDDSL